MTGEQMPYYQDKSFNERLNVDLALKAARLGVWVIDPIRNVINWDDRCQELFGLTNTSLLPYKKVLDYIHPDDADRVDKATQWAMNPQSNGVYDITFRTVGNGDGQLRWVRFIGKADTNETGEVNQFSGVAQDVTIDTHTHQENEVSEQHFRNLIQEAPFAIGLYTSRTFTISLANEAMIKVWGKPRR